EELSAKQDAQAEAAEAAEAEDEPDGGYVDVDDGGLVFDEPDPEPEPGPKLIVHAGWEVLTDLGWEKVRACHGQGTVSLRSGRKLLRGQYRASRPPGGSVEVEELPEVEKEAA